MKRSKLFLGATTAVLAIAGVAAAKHYGDSVQRFYITKNSGYCQGVVSTCTKTAGANQCFFYSRCRRNCYKISTINQRPRWRQNGIELLSAVNLLERTLKIIQV